MLDREIEENPSAKQEHDKTQKAIAAGRLKKNAEYNRAHPKQK